jgi:glycosyltransferase involved in cell wall biosynthesis
MSTNSPNIAVLLPSYNPGPEIVGTLDSLRAQSIPFRLFLVDDGSAVQTD